MALQLAKTLSTGLVANYWKITNISYDLNNNALIVTFDLYADLTAKQNNCDVVWHGDFTFSSIGTNAMDTIFKTGNNFVNGTYTYLKTQSQFLNAVDI